MFELLVFFSQTREWNLNSLIKIHNFFQHYIKQKGHWTKLNQQEELYTTEVRVKALAVGGDWSLLQETKTGQFWSEVVGKSHRTLKVLDNVVDRTLLSELVEINLPFTERQDMPFEWLHFRESTFPLFPRKPLLQCKPAKRLRQNFYLWGREEMFSFYCSEVSALRRGHQGFIVWKNSG